MALSENQKGTLTILGWCSLATAAMSIWVLVGLNDPANIFPHKLKESALVICIISFLTIFSLVLISTQNGETQSLRPGTAPKQLPIWVYVGLLTILWPIWTGGVASYTKTLGGGFTCKHPSSFEKTGFFLHSPIGICVILVLVEALGWIDWILLSFVLCLIILQWLTTPPPPEPPYYPPAGGGIGQRDDLPPIPRSPPPTRYAPSPTGRYNSPAMTPPPVAATA